MRFILAGILVTLGVFQLIDLQTTNPKVGYTLTGLVILLWGWEVWKTVQEKRK